MNGLSFFNIIITPFFSDANPFDVTNTLQRIYIFRKLLYFGMLSISLSNGSIAIAISRCNCVIITIDILVNFLPYKNVHI